MIKRNGLDTYNIHGEELCHAINCRKHKRLHEGHGGKFCSKHLKELDDIREQITHQNNANEIPARSYELKMRKYMCERHLHYLWELNQKSVGNITYQEYVDNMQSINMFTNEYLGVMLQRCDKADELS